MTDEISKKAVKKLERFIPSIADVIFLAIFLYSSFSIGQSFYLRDDDTCFHIRAGEIMLENLSIIRMDPFSWITPTLKWTPPEWLSEVIMAAIHRVSGLTGVIVFYALLIAITHYLLFLILKKECHVLTASAIIFLVVRSSSFRWLARPHIFTFLLLFITYAILDTYERRQRNYLYMLPLIMLLWVNLHGCFLIGLILISIYWAGYLCQYFLNRTGETSMNPGFTKGDENNLFGHSGEGRNPGFSSEKEKIRKKIAFLTLILLTTLAFSLINPRGIWGLLHPFTVIRDKFQIDHIGEFMSPNFHDPHFFQYFLYAFLVIFALSKKRPDIIEIFLIIAFTHMALYSARNIDLFALICAPIIARNLPNLLEGKTGRWTGLVKRKWEEFALMDNQIKSGIWPLIGILVVFLCILSGNIHYEFPKTQMPYEALKFIKKANLPGNMFNDEDFGQYVIYELWPQYKIFYDSRHQMYGTEIMKEYEKIVAVMHGLEDVIKKYQINWFFIKANSTLSILLKEKAEWRLIYSDDIAHIFIRNSLDYLPVNS